MKRERTQNYDVLRLADRVSVVERKSGAVLFSFDIPCDETRKALVKMLSDPCKSSVTTEIEQTTTGSDKPTTGTATKKTTTKKSTAKK